MHDAKAKVLSTGVLLEQHFDSNSALSNALACDWGTTVVVSKPVVLALHYRSVDQLKQIQVCADFPYQFSPITEHNLLNASSLTPALQRLDGGQAGGPAPF